MMNESKPLGGKILTRPFLVFLAFAFLALFFLAKRFIYGLGAVSNMNDGYPWGIWIAYDDVVGTALACGGYSMALLVYVFNRGKYHPLVRSAILVSLFGFVMAGISVFVDIGRYWQVYNIFLPWLSNYSSVMLEVSLCITIYIIVLLVEFAPVVFEKFGAEKMRARLNRVLFFFIALGILLPTMQQSSLGTLMMMAGHKLSPLWWTGLLPLLFLVSAVIMGYAAVILESMFASVAFKRRLEINMLAGLGSIMLWLLGFYLAIRIADVGMRGYLPLVFNGSMNSNMFLLENILGLISFALLIYPANRKNPQLLFMAAVALLFAGGLYRFNSYLVGFDPGNGWRYFPSVSETLIMFGFLAAEIMGYLLIVKKLPVLPGPEHA